MDWKKERDLLIAQALTFVQSVAAKKELPGAESDIAVAPVGAIEHDLTDDTPTSGLPLEYPVRIAEPPKDKSPRDIRAAVDRTAVPSDIRTEIRDRIASFRAHQQRFHREREEFFSATMAKARNAVADGSATSR